jgi:hypothetical protein
LEEGFKKSDVEILLSTMNRSNLDFLVPMFPFAHFSDFNILIVNQTSEDVLLTSQYSTIRVVNAFEKGLSRSRNMLMENASKKLGLIADDDLVFLEGFDEKVAQGFNLFKEAAAVKFITVTFEGVPFRKYPRKPVAHLNAMLRLNSSSIEMALSIEKVRESGIKFNTHFGLGSTFPLGEEPIFINELHDAGYQVSHVPEIIVSHKAEKDSDNISLEENYRIRGAYLQKIFGPRFSLWIAIQLLYHLKSGEVKPWQILYYLKHAMKGRKEFLRLKASS